MFHSGRLATAFLAASILMRTAQGQTASVEGKWAGILDIVHADGSVAPNSAYLELKQKGSTVSGTAGESVDHASPISLGTISGNQLKFNVGINSGTTVKFDLTLDGDHLRGSAAGSPSEAGSRIVVEVTRSGDATNPVAHLRDQLYAIVAELDLKLFDAYNHCDLATLGKMVAEDLEFYHDKTGLAVGRQVFLESVKQNICGKVRRSLVSGTLEVHRLAGFGAAEMGTHRFSHPGQEDNVGEAKFVHLWKLQDGKWKVTRVISYDHGAAVNASLNR